MKCILTVAAIHKQSSGQYLDVQVFSLHFLTLSFRGERVKESLVRTLKPAEFNAPLMSKLVGQFFHLQKQIKVFANEPLRPMPTFWAIPNTYPYLLLLSLLKIEKRQ